MKIIFLDIDGVLNTEPNLEKGEDLDPKIVRLLGELTRQTSAGIVITSSWRHRFSVAEMKKIFKEHDFGGEVPIVGTTSIEDPEEDRGSHIKKFIKDNDQLPIDSYVIIDDRHKESLSKKQLKRFVHTDSKRGASRANFYKAKMILNKPIE